MVRLFLNSPFTVGPYRCERVVGRGNWGTVYRAVTANGSAVAVKVIDSHPNPARIDRDRFERVTARLGRLEHPNIVEVLDASESEVYGHNVLWIAMPLFDRAVTLQHFLDPKEPLRSEDWTRRVVGELAGGLGELRRHQVVHRDLKPENILVLPDGSVVIIDFDVACLVDDDRGTPLGREFGTARYRAPEQLDGECGPGSDLWALGVIAYELYTGRHPFGPPGIRGEELMRSIRTLHPLPPSRHRPGLSPREDDLVLRLLDKVAWRRGVVEVAHGGSELKARRGWRRDRAPLVSITAETRGDVDAAADAVLAGHAPDSVVVTANRRAPLAIARRRLVGTSLAIEPAVAPFAFPSWEEKKSLRSLDYRPAPGELYDERLLDDPERLRTVARSAVRQAARSGVDRLIAPWTVSTDAVDLRMLVSLRMLGETLNARDETSTMADAEVAATIALPIGAVADSTARTRIANAIAGYPFDVCRLALKDLGWSSSPRQIAAAIQLALLLQESGRPVFAMVSNPLRELFWAVGVAGVEGIPARRQRQALPGPGVGRGRTPPPRFEFASLATPLPADEAMAVLASDSVPEASCTCFGCAERSLEDRVAHPATHNVLAEVRAAAELEGLDPGERCSLLRERLSAAQRLGRGLVLRGVPVDVPNVAERLLAALDTIEAAGLIAESRRSPLRRAV